MTEKTFNDDMAEIQLENLENNIKIVRENIEKAAIEAKRDVNEITLLAATKTVCPRVINRAIELGITHIGENKVQELMDKYDLLDLKNTNCQFIGHLQTNKVKYIVGKVSMIQSVDSQRLAEEISKLSVKRQVNTDILIEVNIGREENKSGVMPENLEALLSEVQKLESISVRGLMTVPPICESREERMHYFSEMNEYFVDIMRKKSDNSEKSMILSMGMSSDYYEAILCGATMVRVGSQIFGNRIYHK